MEFGLQVVSDLNWFYVGLDLGQRPDYSALVVLERADILLDDVDWATYERQRARRYRVRFVERVALGAPYPVFSRDSIEAAFEDFEPVEIRRKASQKSKVKRQKFLWSLGCRWFRS